MVRREAGSTAPDPAPRITAPPPVDGIVTPEPGPVLDLSDFQPTPTKCPDMDTMAQAAKKTSRAESPGPRLLLRPRRATSGAAALSDLPIARLGRQCPFHPIACGVTSGPVGSHGGCVSKA